MPSSTNEIEAVKWLTAAEQAAWRGLMRMQSQLAAQLSRDLSARSGLSLQDYGVLVLLSEHPDGRLRPYEIGHELGLEKSRLSHHVVRMEARGLVERQRCASDHRGLFVAITDAGRQSIKSAAPGHVAEVRKAFVDLLTREQLATLAAISDAVVGALDGVDPECDGS